MIGRVVQVRRSVRPRAQERSAGSWGKGCFVVPHVVNRLDLWHRYGQRAEGFGGLMQWASGWLHTRPALWLLPSTAPVFGSWARQLTPW